MSMCQFSFLFFSQKLKIWFVISSSQIMNLLKPKLILTKTSLELENKFKMKEAPQVRKQV